MWDQTERMLEEDMTDRAWKVLICTNKIHRFERKCTGRKLRAQMVNHGAHDITVSAIIIAAAATTVVWPTMSCFADWSKHCHVTLSIIICSPLHPGWRHVMFTKCKHKIYSTLFLSMFCLFLASYCKFLLIQFKSINKRDFAVTISTVINIYS